MVVISCRWQAAGLINLFLDKSNHSVVIQNEDVHKALSVVRLMRKQCTNSVNVIFFINRNVRISVRNTLIIHKTARCQDSMYVLEDGNRSHIYFLIKRLIVFNFNSFNDKRKNLNFDCLKIMFYVLFTLNANDSEVLNFSRFILFVSCGLLFLLLPHCGSCFREKKKFEIVVSEYSE